MTDKQLDAWRMKQARANVTTMSANFTEDFAREYHRLIATDARPVEDEAESVAVAVLREYNSARPVHKPHGCAAIIRAALDNARSQGAASAGDALVLVDIATARAEKAERERDEANAVIDQIEKLPSVKMAAAIQMILAQRTAPEKGE